MAIQSIETLKEYFETGKKPTQDHFHDFIDTAMHGDIIINIDPRVSYSEMKSALHFTIEIASDPHFTDILNSSSTILNGPSGWEYFNNVSFQPFPSGGLPYTYQNPIYGSVTYTLKHVLRGQEYYVRYRSSENGIYSNFKAEKIGI